MSYISRTGSPSVWSFYDPFRAERAVRKAAVSPAGETSKGLDAAEVRQRLMTSANALRDAFNSLSRNLRRITMPTLEGNPGSKALARATIVPASTYSVLQSTIEVNASASAMRSSAGLLGLDTTTPEAASVLESIGAMGLDVSSPERSSVLQSSRVLGLDTTTPESASRIESTGEANTMATSYGVVQAAFNNGQTSLGNLTGTYRGTGAAANATSLTLKVTSLNGTMGSGLLPTLVSLEVTDQNGTALGTYSALLRTGDQLSLGNDIGLSIAFTAGSIRSGATTTFAVSNTTATDVDPAAIFNAASVNDRPRFENGAQVTAGSFTVNGTAVQVFANDSINSVLQRINSTVSGITASFQDDRVIIETSSASEDNIALGSDTSGFFAALKLNGATATRGNVRDDLQVFSKTSQFSSVTNGSFRVNGQAIAIDRLTDSLQTVLDRINSSSAGVRASYDAENDRIVLASEDPSEDLIVVDNDTTGFLNLSALHTSNSVIGNIRDDRQVLSKVTAFSAVTNGTFEVNGAQISLDAATDTLETLISRINAAVPGIQASYDSLQDKLVFATTNASEDEIILSNDSTGFLSASQVDAATTTRGNVRDDEQVLAKVTQFSGLTAGSFEVNGVVIAVDPGTDSLNDILARINASGTGVAASYDPTGNRVILDPGSDPLALENDTSGFLEAVQIETGTWATRVNENGAFNASGLEGARFEPGVAVTAGSFTVNGVEILVEADDSIREVLDKITASSADVTATFNGLAETVTLRAKQSGQQLIAVGNDSSGFLSAVKLDGTATFTNGNSGSEMLLRDSVPGAAAGIIQLNDELISIDPDAETLQTLAQKLDAVAGVEAFLDNATGAFTIRSESEGGSVVIADSTGILAALGILDGTYTGEASTLRTVQSKSSKFQVLHRDKVVDGIMESFATLNQALGSLQNATGLTLAFRDDLQSVVRDSLAAIPDARGKGFTVINEASQPLSVKIERSLLMNALRQNGKALEELYKGENSLADALEDLAGEAAANLLATPAPRTTTRPTPAAAVAAEVADDFYKVGSASQLFLIESISTASLTPPEPSLVVPAHERYSAGDLESSRSFSRATG
jgi:hypothetical protein